MATIEIDRLPNELGRLAADAFYVTVGTGVLLAQKANVARTDLQKRVAERNSCQLDQLTSQYERLTGQFDSFAKERREAVTETMQTVEARVDELLDQMQGRLPEGAGDAMSKARARMKEARERMASRFADTGEAGEAAA